MQTRPRPFWKQPAGIVLLAFGALVVLATGWMALTRLGPAASATSADLAPLPPRIDDNALVAAHAERPGATTAAAQDNRTAAAAGGKPGTAETPEPAASDKPPELEQDFETAIEEAQRETEEAIAEAEAALEEARGGK